MESRKLTPSKIPTHGGSRDHYSQDGTATESARTTTKANAPAPPTASQASSAATASAPAARHPARGWRSPEGSGGRLHATHRRALRGLAVGGHPDHGLPHHPQFAAHREWPGPRPSVQLSPGLFQALL